MLRRTVTQNPDRHELFSHSGPSAMMRRMLGLAAHHTWRSKEVLVADPTSFTVFPSGSKVDKGLLKGFTGLGKDQVGKAVTVPGVRIIMRQVESGPAPVQREDKH